MDYDQTLYAPDYRELLARRAADPLYVELEDLEPPMPTNRERAGIIILIVLAIWGVGVTLLVLLGAAVG